MILVPITKIANRAITISFFYQIERAKIRQKRKRLHNPRTLSIHRGPSVSHLKGQPPVPRHQKAFKRENHRRRSSLPSLYSVNLC